uniref:Coiled-coil domain-containing protein 86 n=1 Tax=Mesocestoides corti TaxID=53468 RepID=A0A5K3FJ39_MESCO
MHKDNSKKVQFKQLMQQQRVQEIAKKEKRQMILEKRKAREKKRRERNVAWRKLTKKGQPVMKERIKYMLAELENMRK